MEERALFLQYIPKTTDPKDSARVYFACHPADHNAFFETLSQDLLTAAQRVNTTVTVWHRNGQTMAPEQADSLKDQLSAMQLLVVPVTASLLQDRAACMDLEIAWAKENNVPILPILRDRSLINAYSLPENFGQLQFLEPEQTDATALPYTQKLQDSVSTVLVADDLRQKVRQAFAAYIFLSYRKKDRQAAQELMRAIHRQDFCRDIAIWYDEFLTPGENFSKAIEDALEKSRLVAMVVTPNITEPNNYVIENEYPMARQAGKPILPLECVPTDRSALEASFAQLPAVTDARDGESLAQALQAHLQTERTETPEQHYLMGTAYLNGIDVEVDTQRAVQLLTRAAEEKHPQAMIQLAQMYQLGRGVPRNYETALRWLEDSCGVLVQLHQQEGSRWRTMLINALKWTAKLYHQMNDYRSAERFARELGPYCTLGFRETGDVDFVRERVNGLIMEMAAQGELMDQEITGQTPQEAYAFLLNGLLKIEAYIDEQNLNREQKKALGEAYFSILAQAAMIYAAQDRRDKCREYAEKAAACEGVPQKDKDSVLEQIEALSQEDMDLYSWLDMTVKAWELIEEKFAATPQSQKQSFVAELLGTWAEAIKTVVRIEENLDPEEMADALATMDALMDRHERLFAQVDAAEADNELIAQLAKAFGWTGHYWVKRQNAEKALPLVVKNIELARLSFDRYPTELALLQLIHAVEDLESLDPEGEPFTLLWLKLEQDWQTIYRKIPENAAGMQYLDFICEKLIEAYVKEENTEAAEAYANKRESAAGKKFSLTKTLEDELNYLGALYQHCFFQEKNGRPHIDSALKWLLQRYGEMIENYEELGIDADAYQGLAIRYEQTACLLAKVLLGYADETGAQHYIDKFLLVYDQLQCKDQLDNELLQIVQMLKQLGKI